MAMSQIKNIDEDLQSLEKPIAVSVDNISKNYGCLLYTSPSPRDLSTSRMPSSA